MPSNTILGFSFSLFHIYIYICVCVCVCVCVRARVCVVGLFYGMSSFVGLFTAEVNPRVFDNGLGDRGSIPGRVIPKTQKMILDSALFPLIPLHNTQHYKARIKGKVEQSREWSSAPYTSV